MPFAMFVTSKVHWTKFLFIDGEQNYRVWFARLVNDSRLILLEFHTDLVCECAWDYVASIEIIWLSSHSIMSRDQPTYTHSHIAHFGENVVLIIKPRLSHAHAHKLESYIKEPKKTLYALVIS